jgi:hypothetical protein
MDVINNVKYVNTLSDDIKHVIRWKNAYLNTKICIITIDDEHIHIVVDNHTLMYFFKTKILSYDEDDCLLSTICSTIDTNNVFTMLTDIEAHIVKIQSRSSSYENDEHIGGDNDEHIGGENDDTVMFFTIESILMKIRRNYSEINIATTQDLTLGEIYITIKVLKTPYTFMLTIRENKIKLPISFIKVQPDILFKHLLDKLNIYDISVDVGLNLEKTINYISSALSNDIEPHKIQKLNIDEIMKDLYNMYNITLDDYNWNSPSSVCSTMAPYENVLKLETLERLKYIMETNRDNLKVSHMYSIYPIMMHYLNVPSVDIIIENIDHYAILEKILKMLWPKFNLDVTTDISIMIELSDVRVSCAEQNILDFYRITFR